MLEYRFHVDNSSVLLPPNYNKYELPVLLEKKGDQDIPGKIWVYVALFIRRVLDVDTKKEVYEMHQNDKQVFIL